MDVDECRGRIEAVFVCIQERVNDVVQDGIHERRAVGVEVLRDDEFQFANERVLLARVFRIVIEKIEGDRVMRFDVNAIVDSLRGNPVNERIDEIAFRIDDANPVAVHDVLVGHPVDQGRLAMARFAGNVYVLVPDLIRDRDARHRCLKCRVAQEEAGAFDECKRSRTLRCREKRNFGYRRSPVRLHSRW